MGSTAVPGLAAKPIVDVLIGVRDPVLLDTRGDEPFDPTGRHSLCAGGPAAHVAFVAAVVARGFVYRSHGDIPDRLYFRRDVGGRRAHQLHVAEIGSSFWRDHLLFRDILRARPERAAAYAALKRELARIHPDRVAYSNAKGPFVAETLARGVASRSDAGATEMSVVGKWHLTVRSPMGELASTLTLNGDGTGVTSSQLGASPISDAKIDGDSATFTVKIEAMGQEVVLKGKATANGDTLSGRYESPMGASEFTGRRAT